MKKLIAVVCTVFCLLFPGTAAMAETNSNPDLYPITEANLSFAFAPSEDWYVLTRDNLPNNRFVTDYQQDADTLLENMKKSNIYFDAISPNITCELVVSSSKTIFPRTMSDLHHTDLKTLVDQMLNQQEFQDAGAKLQQYQLETVSGREYLRLDFTRVDSGNTFYVRKYMTVINYQLTSFTMTSYSGQALDSSMTAVLGDVLSTVQYSGPPEWLPFVLIIGIFVLLLVGVVVLVLVLARKRRARLAAAAAWYGQAPSAPPMAGQNYAPYAPQPGVPSAPPMAGQNYAPYAPQTNPTDVPAEEASNAEAETVTETGAKTEFCPSCGAPIKPGSRFCEQCGARNPLVP